MQDIPSHISLTFVGCVIASFGFLYYAVRHTAKKSYLSTIILTFLSVWLFLIAFLTFNDFFLDFESRPPRLVLFAGINMIIILVLFSIKRSRDFIGRMPITTLTHIHIIRVPVEIVLWWLSLELVVPESMTFEGTNYDILSGITAPFAAIFLVGLRSKNKLAAILWNLIAVGLLINIVATAIAAAPYFNTPSSTEILNLGVFYFPYVYLPLFVVPVVFFAHLASLYQLIFIPEEEY